MPDATEVSAQISEPEPAFQVAGNYNATEVLDSVCTFQEVAIWPPCNRTLIVFGPTRYILVKYQFQKIIQTNSFCFGTIFPILTRTDMTFS